MKALRASIKALFVKSRSSRSNESISRPEAPDESPFRAEPARDNPRRKGVHDSSGSLNSMSPGRMVITESVDQSDECCSCLSGSTSMLDEIFGVNPCPRSEAIAAINGEIEIEKLRFTRLKGTASQALAKAGLNLKPQDEHRFVRYCEKQRSPVGHAFLRNPNTALAHFASLCTFTMHTLMVRPEADPPQPQRGCSDIASVSLVSVALKNIGVSLLVRGAYRLSMETFRDSIAVLERVDHQLKPAIQPFTAS
jgi:hypothetical protein